MVRFVPLVLAAAVLAAQNRNTLSPREIAEGWILLYDGESAFGWTPEGGAQWSTDPDGDLRAKSGDSGDMVHNTIFGEYQLTCELKAAVAKGSGLVLNGVVIPPPRPDDKWHRVSVLAAAGKLVASMDGKKVLEQALTLPGTIVLHYRKGDSFSLRDLKLHPLGLNPLFNAFDLSGWRIVPAPNAKVPAEWSVRDGMIHVVHGAGQLETEAQFRDFVLQLDIRTNTPNRRLHPNSGVFLRGDPNGFWTGYESQIRNEFDDQDRSKPVDFGTGGIYRHQPARKVVSDDNEFFTKTIVVRGRHLAVWVNGYQVSDWDDPSETGKVSGTISLQAHDPTTDLDFRNLRIAEIR